MAWMKKVGIDIVTNRLIHILKSSISLCLDFFDQAAAAAHLMLPAHLMCNMHITYVMLLLRFHSSNEEIEKAAHTSLAGFILYLTSLKIYIHVNFETVLAFTLLDCITFGDKFIIEEATSFQQYVKKIRSDRK